MVTFNRKDNYLLYTSYQKKDSCILALRYSDGLVSVFIQRYLKENPTVTWANFKEELEQRYGEVKDTHVLFKELQGIEQSKTENIQGCAN